jgi:hypothetical protein
MIDDRLIMKGVGFATGLAFRGLGARQTLLSARGQSLLQKNLVNGAHA